MTASDNADYIPVYGTRVRHGLPRAARALGLAVQDINAGGIRHNAFCICVPVSCCYC